MALLDLLGRRWILRVLWELSRAPAPLTFRDLRALCSDMSSSVLTRRLAELREARLVDRADLGGYMLSPLGIELVASLEPLLEWGRTWADALAVETRGAATSRRTGPANASPARAERSTQKTGTCFAV